MTSNLAPRTSKDLELADVHAAAARRLGRPLTLADKRIDLLALDKAIEDGKQRLQDAIEAEKRRAIHVHVERRRTPVLVVTAQITGVLEDLYEQGRAEGVKEIRAAGLEPISSFAMREPDPVKRAKAKLKPRLAAISRRIEVETSGGQTSGRFDDLSRGAVLRAVDRAVPGARDAASRVITTSLYGGVGDIYSLNGPLFPQGFMWSAALDQATCDICSEGDGTEYATFAEGEVDLPGGGPAEGCLGDGRCRCRLAPL